MPTFTAQFLSDLEAGLSDSPHAALSASVRHLTVHSFVEGRNPISQFIYVVDKTLLPSGQLLEVILKVPGLFCLFLHDGKIVAVETLSRDVLDR